VLMGFRNLPTLLLLFLMLMMVFGTSRLRDVGTDLAAAIKSFRKGLQDDADEPKKESNTP